MVVYHDGKHNELLNICNNSSQTLRIALPPEEKTDFDHFIKTHRNVFDVQHHKSLFIGFTWVLPMEQKLFHHFPEVICVDAVHTINETNKDKDLLLTISGRDTHDKMSIMLRSFYQMKEPRYFVGYFRWLNNFLLMYNLK